MFWYVNHLFFMKFIYQITYDRRYDMTTLAHDNRDLFIPHGSRIIRIFSMATFATLIQRKV
jgi:hypothetical protein